MASRGRGTTGRPGRGPTARRGRGRLPEDVDRDAAARIPVTADAQPCGLHLVEQALADADGDVLVEAAMVAEAAEVELERLAFDDRLAGGIVDHEVGEVGLAGDRAERGEFGHREAHEVERAGARVGDIVELRFLRGGGKLRSTGRGGACRPSADRRFARRDRRIVGQRERGAVAGAPVEEGDRAREQDEAERHRQANSSTTASGESLSVAPTIPAKATPNRLSPTISPVAMSTPSRSAKAGLGARSAHLL